LVLIETNFYGGVGTKLKATAGEYRTLQQLISNNHEVAFIWITDGLGWIKTQTPLRQAFDNIDQTINIKMMLSGLLEKIILESLK
jgi:type II restriction enzyme